MRKTFLLCLLIPALSVVEGCAENQDSRTLDREAISEQVAEYGRLWDRKDSEGVSQLFLEDGAMEWFLAGAPEQPPVVSGRANILEYTRQAHQVRLAGRQSRHHFSGLVFEELSASEAVTEHMFMVTHVVPGEPPVLIATGFYRIEWKKTERGWLMSHRKLHVDR